MELTDSLTLAELLQKLHVLFEAETVPVGKVEELLVRYKSTEADWQQYAKFDPHRSVFLIFLLFCLIHVLIRRKLSLFSSTDEYSEKRR